MKRIIYLIWGLALMLSVHPGLYSQNLQFNNLPFETDSGNRWTLSDDLVMNPFTGKVDYPAGDHFLIGDAEGDSGPVEIRTKWDQTAGDIEFEFMVSPHAQGLIGLPGGIGVALSDSWSPDKKGALNGSVVIPDGWTGVNKIGLVSDPVVSFMPGVWQTAKIRFQIRKDDRGHPAELLLEKVQFNGKDIQNDLIFPYFHAMASTHRNDGKMTGNDYIRLEVQAGVIGFKNLKIGSGQSENKGGNAEVQQELNMDGTVKQKRKSNPIPPMYIPVSNQPVYQRSFLFVGEKKLLTCISVSFPERVNYSYDMETGNLLQVWRGGFGEVSSMRYGRGVDQVLKPLGVTRSVNQGSSFYLKNKDGETNEILPERLGYSLKNGKPVYKMGYEGMIITDQPEANKEFQALDREIRWTSKSDEGEKTLYHRLAKSSSIREVDRNLYRIDDQGIFIKVNAGEAEIRSDGDQQELVMRLHAGSEEGIIHYSVFW